MMYSRQDVKINTKITNEEMLAKMVQPIVDFTNKHDIYFELGFDSSNCVVATYGVEGRTSAYCKGMVAEIKQMLKDTFRCKIDVLLYVY